MRHNVATLVFVSALLSLALFNLFFPVPHVFFWMIVVTWLAIVVWGSSRISSQYHLKSKYSGKTDEKIVALSFDDGPGEFTHQVLALLETHGVSATFFCIGQQLKKYPDLARQIVNSGHDIGNHSYSHSRWFDFFSTPKVVAELRSTDTLIHAQTGKKPRWFRPPYGVTSPSIARAVAKTRHEVIGWNIRSNDGVSTNEDYIFNRVIKGLKPGGIILMHDTRESSVRVLERILVTLPLLNYRVVPLAQLLNTEAYES